MGLTSLVVSVRIFSERLNGEFVRPILNIGDTISWVRGEDEMKELKRGSVKTGIPFSGFFWKRHKQLCFAMLSQPQGAESSDMEVKTKRPLLSYISGI